MLPRGDDYDSACEYAIDFLLSRRGDARKLAGQMARQKPERAALELIFILAGSASGIETNFSDEQSSRIVRDIWRIAALLGVDLYMMREHGLPRETCGDLLTYWRTEDGFFLV